MATPICASLLGFSIPHQEQILNVVLTKFSNKNIIML
nr:MAG TPA: hypothetical protein [Caudoviricetes sp.]